MIAETLTYKSAVMAAAVLSYVAVLLAFLSMSPKGRAVIKKFFYIVKTHKAESAVLAPFLLCAIVWGGTKPEPPPVVTEEGINLKTVVQSPHKVYFAWEAEDDRIPAGATFIIQNQIGGDWHKLGETTNHWFESESFTINRKNRFRIMTDITENEEGGGNE